MKLSKIEKQKPTTPEKAALAIKKDLKQMGLAPEETFTVKNPITGKKTDITIRRDGTPESELAIALSDPKTSREAKDHTLSMYLWGRGAENASFLMDIMRYKGEHTKESRKFASQMRFDFEAFVSVFTNHTEEKVAMLSKLLGVDIADYRLRYMEWLKDRRRHDKENGFEKEEYTLFDFDFYGEEDKWRGVMLAQAVADLDTAEHMTKAIQNIARAREREKGGGIYIDRNMKIYAVNDPDLTEIIDADRKARAEIDTE
jgi:hypothetical protein